MIEENFLNTFTYSLLFMIDILRYRSLDIIYGITKANRAKFTPLGFTISKTEGVSDTEVRMCRKALAVELGFLPENSFWQNQVHGTESKILPDESTTERKTDAMITLERGVLLCASVADCCGIVLYSNSDEAVAVVHSGWRGTQKNIVENVVIRLNKEYNVLPQSLSAWLSPCASGESYVVRSDVKEYFPSYCREVGEDQYLFDNTRAIRDQLLNCGILNESISYSKECTIANYEYHSHRRDGSHAGRMGVFVGMFLKPSSNLS